MKKLILIACTFAASSSFASVCSVQVTLEGFNVYQDARYIQTFPNVDGALKLKNELIEAQVCYAEANQDLKECSILATEELLTVRHDKTDIQSFINITKANDLKDHLIDSGICKQKPPTDPCTITASDNGFAIYVGKQYLTTKPTAAAASTLKTNLITTKTCL